MADAPPPGTPQVNGGHSPLRPTLDDYLAEILDACDANWPPSQRLEFIRLRAARAREAVAEIGFALTLSDRALATYEGIVRTAVPGYQTGCPAGVLARNRVRQASAKTVRAKEDGNG